jgi:inorganic pyrophosphatase
MAEDKNLVTVEVVVDTPRREHNRYTYDYTLRALRLVDVVYPDHYSPADLGSIPETLTRDGHPVGVFLIVNAPTTPGCRVEARPIGLLQISTVDSEDRKVVAVIDVDPHFANVRNIADLSQQWRSNIEGFIGVAYQDGSSPAVEWQSVDEAIHFIRGAQHAYRFAKAQGRTPETTPAWIAGVKPANTGVTAKETDATSEAEKTVYTLPYRFQSYIEQCLQPEERILFHVLRSALNYGGLPFFQRRQSNESILVITDYQLMVMTDVKSPDATYVQWGYAVRTCALERLQRAEIITQKPYPRLVVEVEASGGVETIGFDFQPEAMADVSKIQTFLSLFLPKPDNTHLRRLPELVEDRASINEQEEELGLADIVENLENRAKTLLGDNEFVFSRAMAPAVAGRKPGPRLLLLTRDRLLIVGDGRSPDEVLNLTQISSLKLHNSVLGYDIEFAMPETDKVRRLVIGFDSASASRFLRLFRTMRSLLGMPIARAVSEVGTKD